MDFPVVWCFVGGVALLFLRTGWEQVRAHMGREGTGGGQEGDLEKRGLKKPRRCMEKACAGRVEGTILHPNKRGEAHHHSPRGAFFSIAASHLDDVDGPPRAGRRPPAHGRAHGPSEPSSTSRRSARRSAARLQAFLAAGGSRRDSRWVCRTHPTAWNTRGAGRSGALAHALFTHHGAC